MLEEQIAVGTNYMKYLFFLVNYRGRFNCVNVYKIFSRVKTKVLKIRNTHK